jgi:hypothetical protein
MRYGMPAPRKQDPKEADWLENLRTRVQREVSESVRGVQRKPIDPLAFVGNWGRKAVKP